MSFKILREKIKEKNNPAAIGLDPRLEYIPAHITSEAIKKSGKTQAAAGEAIYMFNKGLIDACFDLVPAVKPQSAYYEMYGAAGIEALNNTIAYAKSKGLYVILDAKRGDIGATCEAYSAAYLGETDIFGEKQRVSGADCLTVNPYFGTDGIKPFIKDCEKYDRAVFVLVKTSNDSSGDFQDIAVESGGALYGRVARKVLEWGGADNIGVVIGATYPAQLAEMRELMPDTFFLVPGFGAQGAAAQDVRPAFDAFGGGAIINSSRAVMCAWVKPGDGENFGKRARDEAIRMRDAINGAIGGETR